MSRREAAWEAPWASRCSTRCMVFGWSVNALAMLGESPAPRVPSAPMVKGRRHRRVAASRREQPATPPPPPVRSPRAKLLRRKDEPGGRGGAPQRERRAEGRARHRYRRGAGYGWLCHDSLARCAARDRRTPAWCAPPRGPAPPPPPPLALALPPRPNCWGGACIVAQRPRPALPMCNGALAQSSTRRERPRRRSRSHRPGRAR